MTNNAAWSLTTFPANPGNYSFSSDRLSITPLTSSQGIVVTTQGVTTGKYIAAIQFTGGVFNAGLFDSSSIGAVAPSIGLVFGSGTGNIYYSASGGGYSSVAVLGSAAVGDWIVVKWDMSAKLAWFSLVHAGVAGEWNGSATADPDTGVGGLSISAIGTCYFGNWFYSPAGTPAVLNSGSAAYAGGITGGSFGNLPSSSADSALAISSVSAIENGLTTVSWHCWNYPTSGGLSYNDDDSGTWQAANVAGSGLSDTGSSGVFASTTFTDTLRHTISIRENSNTSDLTPDFAFLPLTPGIDLLQIDLSITGVSSAQTFALGSTDNIAVNFVFDCPQQDGEFGSGTCDIIFYNSSGAQLFVISPSIDRDYTAGSIGIGPSGAEQTASITGDSIFASGNVSLTVSGGNVVGSYDFVTSGGTISSTGTMFLTGSTDSNFTSLTIGQGGTRGENEYLLSVTTPPNPPETLTITGASCVPGGTLSIEGASYYGPPSQVDISTDGGATWLLASTFSSASGTTNAAYSCTDGTLSAGTYELQTRDSLTHVESNTYSLDVEPETITLTTLGGALGTVISFDGVSNFGPPANVDVSIDGTWASSTSFTSASGTVNAALSGTAGTITANGTYTVELRDTAKPSVVSNAETINLTTATGTLYGTLSIGGNSFNGPQAGLNVSLDDGSTFAAVTGYETASGTIAAAWTASGPTLTTAGTYTIEVQDSAHTGVVSNAQTLVVDTPAETITLDTATGVNGSPLALAGLSSYGPPAGLNVSLDGGTTYAPVSSYVTEGGHLAVPWTGQGPTLSPGTYEVCVQDSADTAIVSNIVDLVVAGGGGGGGGGINLIPSWSASDFLAAFQRLMPRGRAWPLQLTAVMNQVLAALMPTYQRVASAAANLLIDGFPATCVNLLPEWEASLGLPDACTPLGATIAQQQAAVVQKFIEGGGQSKPYFIGVAARLGYAITIVESAPAEKTWTVHAPLIAPPTVFRAGQNRAGDLLETIQTNSQLECVLRQIAQAGKILIFSYP